MIFDSQQRLVAQYIKLTLTKEICILALKNIKTEVNSSSLQFYANNHSGLNIDSITNKKGLDNSKPNIE
jgi:hypothetical protein